MKKLKNILVVILMLSFLLPNQVMAAEINKGRLEDLNYLWDTLKETHPNIFANTAEEKFLSKKAEIEKNLNKSSELEFALDLSSLVAMIKDSHTSISIGSLSGSLHMLPIRMDIYQGDWILSMVEKSQEAFLGQKVIAINNISVKEISKRFATVICADNDIKLRRQIKGMFYIVEILEYLNIVDKGGAITVTVRDVAGKTSKINIQPYSVTNKLSSDNFVSLSKKRITVPVTDYDKSKIYKSMALDDKTYYIQFNECSQDKELPMSTFTQQVKNEIDAGNYTKVLIDLRNNGGGSDGVIIPLLNMLSEERIQKNRKLYALIGETTFSSAIINAVMIKEAGGILVGSPTSGSVNHFGSTDSFSLPNSGYRVGCSTKYIGLSDYFEAANNSSIEPLQPDILVEQTLSDYLAGVDTAVEYLKVKGEDISLTVSEKEGLSRGRLSEQLFEIAKSKGKVEETNSNSFKDVFEFTYYKPAVEWVFKNNIMNGKDKIFSPSRLVTREEFAVIIGKFADYLKVTPKIVNNSVSFSDEEEISTEACNFAKAICEWGLLDTISGKFSPKNTLTRFQGEKAMKKLMDNK